MYRDIPFHENPLKLAAHPRVVARQDLGCIRDQRVMHGFGGATPCDKFRLEPVLSGEGKLDAPCAAADDHELNRAGTVQDPLHQLTPAGQEPVNGFHRQGQLSRTGRRHGVGPRADVQRQEIEANRWPVLAEHAALIQIQTFHLVVKQAGAGKTCQGTQIDVTAVIAVVAGNESRQHAGVGCVDVARDQSQA